MKKRFLLFFLTAIILNTSFISSCTHTSSSRSITFFDYFNTFSTLTAYSDSDSEFDEYSKIFTDTLSQYHSLLDATGEANGVIGIHYLNENASDSPVEVSEELLDFLVFAKETHAVTRGYTNICAGAITSIWKTAIKDKSLPSSSDLSEALLHTDIDSLIIDTSMHTVFFSDSGLQLDAGALAKGYVSGILYDRLIEAGCESFMLNLGGNLTAHGKKEDGSSWRGGIDNPLAIDKISEISINISGRSISTSGSYNQSFTIDEQKYHHIIDPYTAYPTNQFISVSVISGDISYADAISTALFSMSKEDGLALVESLDDTEAIWITSNGEYFTSKGFDSYKT